MNDKQSILDVMKDIAKADGNFHVSEKALVVLTQHHWGIDTQT